MVTEEQGFNLGSSFDGAPGYHRASQQGRERALTVTQLARNSRAFASSCSARNSQRMIDLVRALALLTPPTSFRRADYEPLLATSLANSEDHLVRDFVANVPGANSMSDCPGAHCLCFDGSFAARLLSLH